MGNAAQKLGKLSVFSTKPQPVKDVQVTSEELSFRKIYSMIHSRIKRDADLLMTTTDNNAHIQDTSIRYWLPDRI